MVTTRHKVRALEQHGSASDHWRLLAISTGNTSANQRISAFLAILVDWLEI